MLFLYNRNSNLARHAGVKQSKSILVHSKSKSKCGNCSISVFQPLIYRLMVQCKLVLQQLGWYVLDWYANLHISTDILSGFLFCCLILYWQISHESLLLSNILYKLENTSSLIFFFFFFNLDTCLAHWHFYFVLSSRKTTVLWTC